MPLKTNRHGRTRFLAYFQPATNTYGPIDRLRAAFDEALSHPKVVGLIIGTRPDCVGEEMLDLLAGLAERTWLMVEYGLQTVHDRTLDRLNRGHHFDAFLDAYRRSRQRNLNLGVHVILGLPGESRDDMLTTARTLAGMDIHSVKPHNLYAVRNTVLADEVAAGRIRLPEFDEYVGIWSIFWKNCPAASSSSGSAATPRGSIWSGRRGVSTRRRCGRRSRPSSGDAEHGRDQATKSRRTEWVQLGHPM